MMSSKISLSQCKREVNGKLALLYRQLGEEQQFKISCTVRYDLRGTRAGTAQLHYRLGAPSNRKEDNVIYLNQGMLQDPALHQEMVDEVIPHELAHIAAGHLYPHERGHGKQWRSIALSLGCSGKRTHNYDVTEHQVRKVRRLSYRCSNELCAKPYKLTVIRHNRVLKGRRYLCRHCRSALVQDEVELETCGGEL